MFDHTRNTLRERDVLAMEADRLGWCESEGYPALQAMLDASDAHTFALREVAAAIGVPKDVDPLDDLDGLVLAVHAVVQRVGSAAIVAAERDRRIDPVEHARAVMEVYGMSGMNFWRAGNVRRALLARVGPDVLAEVER